MRSLTRRLRPAGALVAAAALVMAAGASAESQDRRVLRVGAIGEGVIATVDGRIRCGARCAAAYEPGAVVTLTAAPLRHFSFVRWIDGCVGTVRRCIVVLDRATTIRALFVRDPGFVDLAVSGSGTVVSEPSGLTCGSGGSACSAVFPQGVPITLTPTPGEDGTFGLWGGACRQAGSGPCRLVPEGADEVAAAFRPRFRSPGTQTLVVSVDANARVVSDPPGIDCPTTCDAEFPSSTVVTLRASSLRSWGVACVGTARECVIVLDDSTGVSAQGTGPPPPPPPPKGLFGLNVVVSGRGFVSGAPGIRCGGATGRLADCEKFFRRGSTVTLRANPARKFAKWGGFCSGKKPRCSVRLTAAKTVAGTAAGRAGRIARFLGVVAVLVTVLGGGSSLLFSLRPGLKPCLGDTDAAFTGAPVFPHVLFRDHLVRTGVPREEAAKEPNVLGAEVRFSYRTTTFRGAKLPVTWSLVTVERDGTLGAVVRGQDRALATTVTPDACSQSGGKDLFVQIPVPRKRYRVVLELYRNDRLDDRLALTETDIFRG